ncbi:hypothetical protein [Streptomyces phaeochromogenes]|uniref:hypothetical protein n=1 Tax=Streptomyces phaeochromogenes TaxID=1923 RepID=UPI0006E32322|nr:hypothetical protein [Streptomyces phaeochromogenes]
MTVTTLLVFLWFQEAEATLYTLVFIPHFFCSLWALWVVVREKIWRGTPYPTRIAAGVAGTAILAGVNFVYSSLYQPKAAPTNLALQVLYKPRGWTANDPSSTGRQRCTRYLLAPGAQCDMCSSNDHTGLALIFHRTVP